MYADNAPLNLGTRGGSGQTINIKGPGINIETPASGTRDIVLKAGAYNKIIFAKNTTTHMTIDDRGVTGNIHAYNLVDQYNTNNYINFRVYSGRLQYRVNTGNWINLE